MSQPPIITAGPSIESDVPSNVRRHLQLIYQKLGNHTQAFSLLSARSAGSTTTNTTVQENITTGGGSTPGSVSGIPVNNQSGVASYSTSSFDNGGLLVLADASPVAVSLVPYVTPYGLFVANQGAGTATLTPASGTISYAGNPGASSMAILANYCAMVAYDGTNWWAWTEPIVPVTFGAVAHEWLTAYNAATGAWTAAQPAFTDISGVATVAQGGTGTATPALVQGTNVTITGSWPNQTINSSTTGLSVTITTAKLTTLGTNGSMTFTDGLLTAQVAAT